MEKNEFRAVIKHFYIKGNTPKEIKAKLDEIHGISAPSFKTVYNWVNEFKRGCKGFPNRGDMILNVPIGLI